VILGGRAGNPALRDQLTSHRHAAGTAGRVAGNQPRVASVSSSVGKRPVAFFE
jgi:hypothetical protein